MAFIYGLSSINLLLGCKFTNSGCTLPQLHNIIRNNLTLHHGINIISGGSPIDFTPTLGEGNFIPYNILHILTNHNIIYLYVFYLSVPI